MTAATKTRKPARRKPTLKTFTVIVLDDRDGEVTAAFQRAEHEYRAIQLAARRINAKGDGQDVQILGVIAGRHELFPSCEDSGKAAWACDLTGD